MVCTVGLIYSSRELRTRLSAMMWLVSINVLTRAFVSLKMAKGQSPLRRLMNPGPESEGFGIRGVPQKPYSNIYICGVFDKSHAYNKLKLHSCWKSESWF